MLPRVRIVSALLALCLGAPSISRAVDNVEIQLMHPDVAFPSTLRFAPDGRLFVLETFTGRVIVYADTAATTPTEWATIPVSAVQERGLLGIAFHPQFPDSPYVYLYHTNPDPLVNRVVRMVDSAGVGVQYTILVDGLTAWSDTHQGGRMAFGPDNMLYCTVGDQGRADYAADVTSPYGKIYRMTSTGKPAPGNPFGPNNRAAVYGVRNDFGLCFDKYSGQGYFTENGPDCDDELNFLQIGSNYGWSPEDPCFGQPAGTKLPMWTITPTIAPTGACIYHGPFSALEGNLIFGSYDTNFLYRVYLNSFQPDVADSVVQWINLNDPVLDVTQGPDGWLWAATATSIWRLSAQPITLSVPPGQVAQNWSVGPNPFRGRVALAAAGGDALRRIDVFDISGRRVRSFQGPFHDGMPWDGTDADGRSLSTSVFLVRATTTSGTTQVRRVIRLAH